MAGLALRFERRHVVMLMEFCERQRARFKQIGKRSQSMMLLVMRELMSKNQQLKKQQKLQGARAVRVAASETDGEALQLRRMAALDVQPV
eukprot:4221074-Alexandrium_andersonii.AAC.1